MVLVDVKPSQGAAAFDVWVHNFATLAILDVEVDSATYTPVPSATFRVRPLRPKLIAVKPAGERDRLLVECVDDKGDSVIPSSNDADGNVRSDGKPEDFDVTIRFMDAHGHHWLRSVDSVKLDKRAKGQ